MSWMALIAALVAIVTTEAVIRWLLLQAGARALDQMAATMAAMVRRDAEVFDRILPLYEDMIRRDPSIAESLEVDRLDLVRYAEDLRSTAVGIELMASTASNRERMAYLRRMRRAANEGGSLESG